MRGGVVLVAVCQKDAYRRDNEMPFKAVDTADVEIGSVAYTLLSL
ncbi:hypothetical protein DOY81_002093 [Sarcophaga bullata]|nr:hypothetical protein DOY81_002093 [Sarcophaga bullata]